MKLRDHYDWVVLGDHPGALLTAGLVSKLGLTVLVLPFAPGVRAHVSKSGQVMDPEPNFWPGLAGSPLPGKDGPPGILARCLERLGAQSSELAQVTRVGALPQVVTPGKRVAFSFEKEGLSRELNREFGVEQTERSQLVAAIEASLGETAKFWASLPERLTLVPQDASSRKKRSGAPAGGKAPARYDDLRRKLERSVVARRGSPLERNWFRSGRKASDLSGWAGDAEWAELCAGLWHGVTLADEDDPALFDLMHLASVAATGAAFQGGASAYREFLLRLTRRLGAQIPEGVECRRVFVEDGKFQGVQVSTVGTMISAGGGVLGCSLAHVPEHVSVSGRHWMKQLKPAPKPVAWRFTLALTVHAEAIPSGMLPRVVWREAGAPAIEIEIVKPEDYGVTSEPGNRLVFLRTLLPFTQESLAAEYQRMTAARMLRQLTELMPFLEYHVVRVYPDFRAENSEISEAFGFASPDMIPENLRVIVGKGVGSRSGIEGLFVASGESFPGLGGLGGTVAAFEATAWLAHRCGLAGPFA